MKPKVLISLLSIVLLFAVAVVLLKRGPEARTSATVETKNFDRTTFQKRMIAQARDPRSVTPAAASPGRTSPGAGEEVDAAQRDAIHDMIERRKERADKPFKIDLWDRVREEGGTSVQGSRGNFLLSPNLRAVTSATLALLDSPEVLGHFRNYTLVYLRPGTPIPDGSVMVALSERTRAPALVTGTIEIKMDPSHVAEVSSDYQLRLIQSIEPLGVHFFSTGKNRVEDLLQTLTILNRDSRIHGQAKLEFLDKAYAAK